MAQRAFDSHPLVVRRVQVRRVEDVTPRMRRVVVGGNGLAARVVDGAPQPAFTAPGFDDHIKIILSDDGDLESALPRQLEHGIEWTPAPNRVLRDYTPRRVDLSAGELDLDFVLHGDGPAAAWATCAQPGDELCFVGPKSSLRLPEHLDWIVLIADETGLPAVGRFLDERPVGVPAHIVVTIGDESARQSLAVRETDTLIWHVAPGDDAAALDAAVRALELPGGPGYVWAAAESRALLRVRRYLQRECGLGKDRLNITGYWAAERTTDADHGTGSGHSADPVTAPIPSPLPWLVTRAAVQLGIVDALAHRPLSLDELAGTIGVPAASVGALVPVLAAHGVVVGEDQLRLGEAGEELLDEHECDELVGLEADLVLALAELAPALRSGDSAWQQTHGTTLAQSAAAEPSVQHELDEHAGGLAYLLDGFVSDPLWEGVRTCVLGGPGATIVQNALADSDRAAVTTVLLNGTEPAPPADLVVLARHLAHRTDAEAIAELVRVSAIARSAVVIEEGRPDGISQHAMAEHVLALARTGAPVRDRDAITALAEAAGWHVDRVIELGWGVEASVLTRA